MPEDSKRVAVDSNPRLSGIFDTVNSSLAHGPETRLPKEFYGAKSMDIIDKIIQEEWFGGYDESQEYRSLGIFSFMGDIVYRMVANIESTSNNGVLEVRNQEENSSRDKGGQSALRLGLSGCHDTTIAAILASLGAFKNKSWPQYSSHIALELFRRSDQPRSSNTFPGATEPNTDDCSKTFPNSRQKLETLSASQRSQLNRYCVWIRYNDKPITAPGCKALGHHLEGDESFCTLEAFKAIVDKYTPTDWRK